MRVIFDRMSSFIDIEHLERSEDHHNGIEQHGDLSRWRDSRVDDDHQPTQHHDEPKSSIGNQMSLFEENSN